MTMKAIVEKYGITAVWHFTDKANLDLIQEHGGLLSLRRLEERDVVVPKPGGNEWSHKADRNKGLDKYVHLAFVDNHPMLYWAENEGRITDAMWVKIDVSVLMGPEVCFCTDVSNKNGVRILDHEEAIEELDFEVLFTRMDWNVCEIHERRKAAEKSEILVPDAVPIDKILGYENGKATCLHTTR